MYFRYAMHTKMKTASPCLVLNTLSAGSFIFKPDEAFLLGKVCKYTKCIILLMFWNILHWFHVWKCKLLAQDVFFVLASAHIVCLPFFMEVCVTLTAFQVTYTGSRDYQRSFQDKRKRFLSSKADELQLCLNLLPVTNYSISITAASSRFTASITTNTSLTGTIVKKSTFKCCWLNVPLHASTRAV